MADTTLFKTVLCPVDFSEHSRQALAYAALLASRSRGRLVVIFVEDSLLASAAAVAYDQRALQDKAVMQLRNLVERTIKPLGLPMSSVTIDVAMGKPDQEIAWTAERLTCDVIVMGAHGRTGGNKMMLGSTTHRLLRRSPLPILATPPVSGGNRGPAKGWPGKMILATVDLGARDRADALAAAVVARELGTHSSFILSSRSPLRRGSRSTPTGATCSDSDAPSCDSRNCRTSSEMWRQQCALKPASLRKKLQRSPRASTWASS